MTPVENNCSKYKNVWWFGTLQYITYDFHEVQNVLQKPVNDRNQIQITLWDRQVE